jgi:predicted nucleic acid-binding protein
MSETAIVDTSVFIALAREKGMRIIIHDLKARKVAETLGLYR